MRKCSPYIILILIFSLVFTPQPSEARELSRREIKVFVKKGLIAYRKEEYWKAKSYYDKVTDTNTDRAKY